MGEMPRGVRGISSCGHKGVPRVSTTATTATTNARGLKGRFSWCHRETPGILQLLVVLLQRGERGYFLAPQGNPRASVSFPSIHPDPICYAMSSCMMQILRRHHAASHDYQSLHQLVSFRWWWCKWMLYGNEIHHFESLLSPRVPHSRVVANSNERALNDHD